MNQEERKELLEHLLSLRQSREDLLSMMDQPFEAKETNLELVALEARLDQEEKLLKQLKERYLESLPVIKVSRCPFSGIEYSLPIDAEGLDGPWWDYDWPERMDNQPHDTFFALDGALKLGGSPEWAPFFCSPGPELPFVLPRLLKFVQVKAVLSSLKIGSHQGYVMVYYAEPMLEGELRVNDWGTGRYWEPGHLLPERWTAGDYVSIDPNPDEYDFDLEPWIKAGKLFWISPEDETLTLHGHVAGCPYLNLSGQARLQYIHKGEIWWDEEEDDNQNEEDPSFDLAHFQNVVEAIERGEG